MESLVRKIGLRISVVHLLAFGVLRFHGPWVLLLYCCAMVVDKGAPDQSRNKYSQGISGVYENTVTHHQLAVKCSMKGSLT